MTDGISREQFEALSEDVHKGKKQLQKLASRTARLERGVIVMEIEADANILIIHMQCQAALDKALQEKLPACIDHIYFLVNERLGEAQRAKDPTGLQGKFQQQAVDYLNKQGFEIKFKTKV